MVSKETQVNLLLKGVEGKIIQAAKLAALNSGLTLKAWIMDLIMREVGDGSREAERVSETQGMQGMRGGVSRRQRAKRPAEVLGPFDDPPTDSGRVGGSTQPDTKKLGVLERPYLGPPHAEDCGCKVCREKRKHGD